MRLLIAAQTASGYEPLNVAGGVIMFGAIGAVTLLLAWCLWKVFTTPGSTEHLHSQADIQTPDAEQPE